MVYNSYYNYVVIIGFKYWHNTIIDYTIKYQKLAHYYYLSPYQHYNQCLHFQNHYYYYWALYE